MHLRQLITRIALPAVIVTVASTVGAADRPYIRSSELPHLMIDRPQPAAFRSDTIELKLAAAKAPGWRVEYKVSMKAADAMVYSLTATGAVVSEFHNEMLPSKAVMFYREEKATTASHGQFVSPADGEHGWYLANTTDKPVTVQIKLSGYYTVQPGIIKFNN